jgi:hypothetical protein
VESLTLKSAPIAHSSGSLHILLYSTFGADSVLTLPLTRVPMSEQDISAESVRVFILVIVTTRPNTSSVCWPWLSASARTASMPSLINTWREHQQKAGLAGWRTNWAGPSSF